jgi:hypothetical protein
VHIYRVFTRLDGRRVEGQRVDDRDSQTYSERMARHAGLPQRHPAQPEVGTWWMLCAFLLGVVAIFAGVAIMEDSSIRSIDILGGALVIGGLGSAAWATGSRSFFTMFIAVVLLATLFGGVVELLDVNLLTETGGL